MKKMPVEKVKGWEYVEEGILKLRNIIEGLPETPFNSEEYMLMYTTIYDLCTDKPPFDYSRELYKKYREIIEEYIASRVLPALRKKHDELLLRELAKRWSNHKVMIRWLSRFFGYLERYFIRNQHLDPLTKVGSSCFRNLVYKEVQGMVTEAAIALINREREGELIDRSLLKSFVEILTEIDEGTMNQCEKDFEMQMLADTAVYYNSKATNWSEVDSCSDYVLKAEECLRKEKERLYYYLHYCTEQKLIETVQHELLVTRENQLLEKENSGLHALLRNNKVDDLCRIYRLYHNIPGGLEPIANMFKEHIIAEGMALFQEIEEAATNQLGSSSSIQEHAAIQKVIEVHERFMSYVNNCFANHSMFHKALKEAFDFFCNKTIAGCSSAEFLTSFCDNVLKKWRNEKQTDEVIEETLDKVIRLLVYINDKDIFAEFYRKRLGRRLLFIQNINDELERNFLIRLKEQFGVQFTGKMENMINDVVMAKEKHSCFEEYLRNNQSNLGMDFSVTVITFGSWPHYKSSDLNLPPDMIKCMESYVGYFNSEKEGRKLVWIKSLGTCHINGQFDQKSIELVVSTYQAAVLMIFNNADRLSYSEIKDQLNLNDEDLVRVLHSLSCAKYKILIKEPNSKNISPDDSFEFNSKFTDKMKKIRIPLPPVNDNKKLVENVDLSRRYAIDAALVRIMKTRKVLNHQQLILECIDHLSPTFKPEIKDIKRRIEDLIARDYLERDRYNMRTIKYMV